MTSMFLFRIDHRCHKISGFSSGTATPSQCGITRTVLVRSSVDRMHSRAINVANRSAHRLGVEITEVDLNLKYVLCVASLHIHFAKV
jgi:hypothetical protein